MGYDARPEQQRERQLEHVESHVPDESIVGVKSEIIVLDLLWTEMLVSCSVKVLGKPKRDVAFWLCVCGLVCLISSGRCNFILHMQTFERTFERQLPYLCSS